MTKTGRNDFIGAGSVYESKEDEMENRLKNELTQKLLRIFQTEDISEVYIVSPDYFLPRVKEAIPKIQQAKIKWTFNENMAGQHPFEVLKVIQKKIETEIGKSVPIKEETRKILQRAEEIEEKFGKKNING